MAMFTIIEAFVGFILTLVLDAFAIIPVYNSVVPIILGSGLVIGSFDGDVIKVIVYVIMGIPIAALVFTLIWGINQMTYKAGG